MIPNSVSSPQHRLPVVRNSSMPRPYNHDKFLRKQSNKLAMLAMRNEIENQAQKKKPGLLERAEEDCAQLSNQSSSVKIEGSKNVLQPCENPSTAQSEKVKKTFWDFIPKPSTWKELTKKTPELGVNHQITKLPVFRASDELPWGFTFASEEKKVFRGKLVWSYAEFIAKQGDTLEATDELNLYTEFALDLFRKKKSSFAEHAEEICLLFLVVQNYDIKASKEMLPEQLEVIERAGLEFSSNPLAQVINRLGVSRLDELHSRETNADDTKQPSEKNSAPHSETSKVSVVVSVAESVAGSEGRGQPSPEKEPCKSQVDNEGYDKPLHLQVSNCEEPEQQVPQANSAEDSLSQSNPSERYQIAESMLPEFGQVAYEDDQEPYPGGYYPSFPEQSLPQPMMLQNPLEQSQNSLQSAITQSSSECLQGGKPEQHGPAPTLPQQHGALAGFLRELPSGEADSIIEGWQRMINYYSSLETKQRATIEVMQKSLMEFTDQLSIMVNFMDPRAREENRYLQAVQGQLLREIKSKEAVLHEIISQKLQYRQMVARQQQKIHSVKKNEQSTLKQLSELEDKASVSHKEAASPPEADQARSAVCKTKKERNTGKKVEFELNVGSQSPRSKKQSQSREQFPNPELNNSDDESPVQILKVTKPGAMSSKKMAKWAMIKTEQGAEVKTRLGKRTKASKTKDQHEPKSKSKSKQKTTSKSVRKKQKKMLADHSEDEYQFEDDKAYEQRVLHFISQSPRLTSMLVSHQHQEAEPPVEKQAKKTKPRKPRKNKKCI